MKYGIFDEVDNCWIGDGDGPKSFTDRSMARYAQVVIGEQLRDPKRFKVKPLPSVTFKHKDTVDAKLTPLEAIRRIEGFNDGS